jgi:hypothetical protein
VSLLEALRDLWGPGLVFLAIAAWLVRKVWKAARTEGELERDRAHGHDPIAGDVLPPLPHASPRRREGLAGADVSQARADHVAAVEAALRESPPDGPVEIAWVRSFGAHAAWLERGLAGAHALHVIRVEDGRAVQRWTFR